MKVSELTLLELLEQVDSRLNAGSILKQPLAYQRGYHKGVEDSLTAFIELLKETGKLEVIK